MLGRNLDGPGCLLLHVCALLVCISRLTPCAQAADCDQTFRSTPTGPKNGSFSSPNWPRPYSRGMQCIYRFVGRPHERVRVNFTQFFVKGVPPRCVDDYVDIYTQAKNEEENLLEMPLHGRYCGMTTENLPYLLISMHHILILGFYSDTKDEEKGFNAHYSFIDGSIYTIGTTPASPTVCGQIVRSWSLASGILLSPTYPGMYPDNIFCFYKLQGLPNQRVKVKFLDFDLYSGGEHCPFDYVQIYDGYTKDDEVIGTYCGNNSGLEVYSTKEAMHIDFQTKSGRLRPTKQPYLSYWEKDENPVQRRGFRAQFEISDRFMAINFIKRPYAKHLIGTECDQRVMSEGESNGTIISPNFPNEYPPGLTCHYYIDGLMDKENLEKVELVFEHFDIPGADRNTSKCSHGVLEAYTRGQEMGKSKVTRVDQKMCGQTLPETLVTTVPRLLLILRTDRQKAGRGFKAHYYFITDYAIPGTPAPNPETPCHFQYLSKSKKDGIFKSPRHPAHYPSNMHCIYDFVGLDHEQIRITFDNFKLENRNEDCSTDYVEVFQVKQRGFNLGRTKWELMGRYCGDMSPGPIVTDPHANLARVVLTSDDTELRSGFRAHYEFIHQITRINGCSKQNMNLTTSLYSGGGVIHSPNYPHKYPLNTTCEYHIRSQLPGGRILLNFESFVMEGNQDSIGCAQAVLNLYTNHSPRPTTQLCGRPDLGKNTVFASQENFLRIKFISTPRAVGAKGFTFSWTELRPIKKGMCDGFICAKSKHCIDNNLKCNKYHNCGFTDKSDEADWSSYTDHGVLHIILGVVIALIVLVFIIVCILHRRRKARKKKNKKEIEVRYVTRGTTVNRTGPAGDRLLMKERTEKVSIV